MGFQSAQSSGSSHRILFPPRKWAAPLAVLRPMITNRVPGGYPSEKQNAQSKIHQKRGIPAVASIKVVGGSAKKVDSRPL